MNRKREYGQLGRTNYNHVRVGVRPGPEPRRDPFGVTVASVLVLSALGLFVLPVLNGGWWWLLALPALLLLAVGAAGLAQDVPKRVRDERGTPVD